MLQAPEPTYAHPVKELDVQVLLHTALLLLLPPRLLLLLLLHSRVHTPVSIVEQSTMYQMDLSATVGTDRLGKRANENVKQWMKMLSAVKAF